MPWYSVGLTLTLQFAEARFGVRPRGLAYFPLCSALYKERETSPMLLLKQKLGDPTKAGASCHGCLCIDRPKNSRKGVMVFQRLWCHRFYAVGKNASRSRRAVWEGVGQNIV